MLCELVELLVHTKQLHIIDHIDAREVAEARLMLHLGDAVGHDVAHAAVLVARGRLAGCADLTHQVVTRHADLEPAVHQHAVRDGMAYEVAGVVCLGLRACGPFLAVPQFPQRLLRGRLVAQRVAVAHLPDAVEFDTCIGCESGRHVLGDEVGVEQRDGATALVVTVPEGKDSPYCYHADGRMEAYVRVGNRSEVADATQLRDLALKGSNQTWDALDSGISVGKASFTAHGAAFANRAGLTIGADDLESFGLATDRGTLTNAGAVLADEPLVRHSRVFCTRWGGGLKSDFEDTDEYEGGLVYLLRESQAFVKRHTTESWEKTDDGRIERRSYSARAVEEALVNALIHRSYLEVGSEVHVDMYDDRMIVRSPGSKIGRPLPEDVMAEPVASTRCNPVIADVFHRLHYMERRGSGLRKICEATAAEDAYRPEFKPIFEADEYDFCVTLWNMNHVATDPATDPVTDPVTEQVAALLKALADRELSTHELMSELGLSHRQTFRNNYLRPALKSGLVERTIPDKPNSRLQKYRRAR